MNETFLKWSKWNSTNCSNWLLFSIGQFWHLFNSVQRYQFSIVWLVWHDCVPHPEKTVTKGNPTFSNQFILNHIRTSKFGNSFSAGIILMPGQSIESPLRWRIQSWRKCKLTLYLMIIKWTVHNRIREISCGLFSWSMCAWQGYRWRMDKYSGYRHQDLTALEGDTCAFLH